MMIQAEQSNYQDYRYFYQVFYHYQQHQHCHHPEAAAAPPTPFSRTPPALLAFGFPPLSAPSLLFPPTSAPPPPFSGGVVTGLSPLEKFLRP